MVHRASWFLAVATATVALVAHAEAQEARPTGPGDFRIRDINKSLVVATDTGGSGVSSATLSKKWLRIEVRFDSAPEWSDDLKMKYYVLMGRGREAKMFVGELNHVNVQKGSSHYSAMFMHPNAVDRHGRGNVEAVAVQLFHQNRLIDQSSDPKTQERWWERFSPQEGVLLPPHFTPWASVAHERYEAVKYNLGQ